jgi:hypothetical protein
VIYTYIYQPYILTKIQNLEIQPYKELVGEYESKDPLGKPRRRWKDVIENVLYKIECDDTGWTRLTQYMSHCDRLNVHSNEPSVA